MIWIRECGCSYVWNIIMEKRMASGSLQSTLVSHFGFSRKAEVGGVAQQFGCTRFLSGIRSSL